MGEFLATLLMCTEVSQGEIQSGLDFQTLLPPGLFFTLTSGSSQIPVQNTKHHLLPTQLPKGLKLGIQFRVWLNSESLQEVASAGQPCLCGSLFSPCQLWGSGHVAVTSKPSLPSVKQDASGTLAEV